jgi:hypothetical protein
MPAGWSNSAGKPIRTVQHPAEADEGQLIEDSGGGEQLGFGHPGLAWGAGR